jgi:hypothetical protein
MLNRKNIALILVRVLDGHDDDGNYICRLGGKYGNVALQSQAPLLLSLLLLSPLPSPTSCPPSFPPPSICHLVCPLSPLPQSLSLLPSFHIVLLSAHPYTTSTTASRDKESWEKVDRESGASMIFYCFKPYSEVLAHGCVSFIRE